jgi:hypothetical protein
VDLDLKGRLSHSNLTSTAFSLRSTRSGTYARPWAQRRNQFGTASLMTHRERRGWLSSAACLLATAAFAAYGRKGDFSRELERRQLRFYAALPPSNGGSGGIQYANLLHAFKNNDRNLATGLVLILGELRHHFGLRVEQPVALLTFDLLALALNFSLPISTVTSGCATRLWYQLGFSGAPPFDAMMT